jgi:hypothetical protein
MQRYRVEIVRTPYTPGTETVFEVEAKTPTLAALLVAWRVDPTDHYASSAKEIEPGAFTLHGRGARHTATAIVRPV